MNTAVSFELAKLLKDKGFDELTIYWHQRGDGIIGCVEGKRDFYNRKGEVYTSAPTIAEVVMWLYENHEVWIAVHPNEPYEDDDWCFTIFKNFSLEGYDSPIEAYEAAISHALTNIVK